MQEQGDQAWKDLRSSCAITWSEAGNALGIGYDSPAAYMRRKLGMEPEKEENWRMMEGRKREPWASEIYRTYMHMNDCPVQLWTDYFRKDWQDHRLGGSVDRIVTLPSGLKWVLEIKTTPNADLRNEVPLTHLIQMLGLCHTYKLDYAHYISWSMSQGFLLAHVSYDERLWDNVCYPEFKKFADMWALRQVPERVDSKNKRRILEAIQHYTHIEPVFKDGTTVQSPAHLLEPLN